MAAAKEEEKKKENGGKITHQAVQVSQVKLSRDLFKSNLCCSNKGVKVLSAAPNRKKKKIEEEMRH